MNENKIIRELIHTDEFDDYFHSLDERTKDKFSDCMDILATVYVPGTKFVKRIVEAEEGIYELRVSVGFNEYRTILFSMNHANIIQAKHVILLNSFLKKNSKDYKKQIKKAINILNGLNYGTEIRP
ncbi:MAG: type II toxin-antitoxin system RelE/ParE family toxin [Tannerella sp.]|jgi:putative component of toxin-antitoxin plasmid stabilization module|nr:type II toxin-antitoxin system RelE/ParE family toxin [Tannerella sp.]